jgi:UDP-2,3-diacylglucosamine hydrolase
MKTSFFISDAHLSFKESESEILKREKLLNFLEFIKTKKGSNVELYILGDLFDFWFEWYHVIPKYWFPILFKFKELIQHGIDIYFITGNHDFYTGRYLEKEVGVKCFNESYQFQSSSKGFFVAHGDGLAKKDRGYRLLKRIIRNPVSIFLYKTFVSADLGMLLARFFSNSSRHLTEIKKHSWSEEYYKYAQKKFAEGIDYVVMGHLHCPMKKEDNGKIYVNSGDWMTHFTYVEFDGQTLDLKWWEEEKSQVD